MSEPISHHVADGINDPAANYSLTSVLVHWLGAIAVVLLFFTHEDSWIGFHTALGLLLAVPLIARVIYRWSVGFPRSVDQHPGLNFLSRFVMISMLVALFIVTVSGILLPLFEGAAYQITDALSWRAPYGGNAFFYEILESAHDVSGHALIPLFVLHILGFLKHRFFDKAANKLRMIKPLEGGK